MKLFFFVCFFGKIQFLKGIVHPKFKICLKFTHPQVIQDVDLFSSSSSEQIF